MPVNLEFARLRCGHKSSERSTVADLALAAHPAKKQEKQQLELALVADRVN